QISYVDHPRRSSALENHAPMTQPNSATRLGETALSSELAPRSRRSTSLTGMWRLAQTALSLVITFLGLLFVTFMIGRVIPIDPLDWKGTRLNFSHVK